MALQYINLLLLNFGSIQKRNSSPASVGLQLKRVLGQEQSDFICYLLICNENQYCAANCFQTKANSQIV